MLVLDILPLDGFLMRLHFPLGNFGRSRIIYS